MSKNGRELPSRERGPPFYVAVNHVAVNHVNPVMTYIIGKRILKIKPILFREPQIIWPVQGNLLHKEQSNYLPLK